MNRFALFGSIMLIIGGLAHLVVVDISALQFEFPYAKWTPESPLSDLSQTTLDFGPLGKTNALRAVTGFSVWVSLSLFFIASQSLLIYRFSERGSTLRLLTWCVNFIISVVFLCVAFTCFIYTAAIGAASAALLFALAIRTEKQLSQKS